MILIGFLILGHPIKNRHIMNTNESGWISWGILSDDSADPDVIFLDVSSHVYKRVCPSFRPSVGDAFVENGKINDFDRK